MTSHGPAELVHVGVKKVGKIPPGGCWRNLGRTVGNRHLGPTRAVAIDAHSRLAYSKILPDEGEDTAPAFWKRAQSWFSECGIDVHKVLTASLFLLRLMHLPRLSGTPSPTAGPALTGRK